MTFNQACNIFLLKAYEQCNDSLYCEMSMDEIKKRLNYEDKIIKQLFNHLKNLNCFKTISSYNENTNKFTIAFDALGIDRIGNDINL